MTTNHDADKQRIIRASLDQPFRFEQGASLHAGILGMVGRPSGPHDEAPFVTGTWHGGRSHGDLDLSQLQASDEETPGPQFWFDNDRAVLDISEAFAGVPASALSGSGIPDAVLVGAVMADRSGDAGDGVMALLTQMCGGKIVIDPHALLDVVGSEHLEAFDQHEVEDERPLRAFNARMSIQAFLQAAGLSSTALVNQIAILGCDIRSEFGPAAAESFLDYLRVAHVQLAWFVDESDQIHTAQVILALTDFFSQLLSSDAIIAQLAKAEGCSAPEMAEFVQKSIEAGRLVYVLAIWQTFSFDDDIEPIAWPEAADLSAEIAAQARRLRSRTAPEPVAEVAPESAAPESAPPESAPPDVDAGERPGKGPGQVAVAPDMLDMMRASSGAMHFVLTDVDGDAVAAMQAAQEAVMEVRHPDEPSGSLASYLSAIIATDNGAQFWADISDMEEETAVLAQVLAAVVGAVRGVVTSAHLSGEPDA